MAKYKNICEEALPKIFYHLDKSSYYHRKEEIKMPGEEFLAVGERQSSEYTFLLKILDGALANNISGTIVARDLYEVLTEDEHLRKWLQNKLLEIRLNSSFGLSISCQAVDSEQMAWGDAGIRALANAYDGEEVGEGMMQQW